MGCLGCVSVAFLRLQIFGNQFPELKKLPMAVVSEDKPLGTVLEVSRSAAAAGVRPGMRYSAALVLAPGLQARAFPDGEIAEAVRGIADRLIDFTPFVEPAELDPGVFWVDAGGIESLFHDHQNWVRQVCAALEKMGYRSRVAVGQTRFGTYSAAKISKKNTFFHTPGEEERFAAEVPLAALPLLARDYEILTSLGIRNVREFLSLPEGSIARRFGDTVATIHRFAANVAHLPVQFIDHEEQLSGYRKFDTPIQSKTRLGAEAQALLEDLATEVFNLRDLIARVDMQLTLADPSSKSDSFFPPSGSGVSPHARAGDDSLASPRGIESVLKPASPTSEIRLLTRLLHLRIENTDIPSPVSRVTFVITRAHPSLSQAELFERPPDRNLKSGDRAFSLIRAEFGNDSVCVATVLPEHLPDRAFSWKPIVKMTRKSAISDRAHSPGAGGKNSSPRDNDRRAPHTSDKTTQSGTSTGTSRPLSPVRAIRHGEAFANVAGGQVANAGAHAAGAQSIIISGSWWEDPYDREYRYVRTADGIVLWLYYDRERRRWIPQGSVN